MKTPFLALLIPTLIAVLCSCSQSNEQEEKLIPYVDPLIGTAHCRWFHLAPGAMPFGLAKPGPSTYGHLANRSGWQASGYDYRHQSIEGFPLFHENQIGGVVIMPTVGELKTIPGEVDSVGRGYRSRFSHDREIARAGYYSVQLDDYNVQAELTATRRVSFLRFTFPQSIQSRILFDIGNRQGESGRVVDAEVELTSDGTVEGWVCTEPFYTLKYQPGATVTMYFSARMDKKPVSCSGFTDSIVNTGTSKAQGLGAGLALCFETGEEESIELKVGQSYTSVENARLNLQAEAEALNFDQALTANNEVWEHYLGRIRVETINHTDKVKFYTGLYHALLGRGVASDINGCYPRHDGSIGQIALKEGKPIHQLYNTDAIWGAQWNLLQLWALAYPDYLADYISSHLLVYKDSGWLGDGLACSRYISGVGTNLVSVFIDAAYQCGIRNFDIETGYEAARKNELNGESRPFGAGKVDTDKFVHYGYVPHVDNAGESVHSEAYKFSASHTLEYAYSAHAVAQMAKQLGRTDDYNRLTDLSKAWERLYDPSVNLIRPKDANGQFIDNFDPMVAWRGFQEGNSFQYTYYIPHAIPQLADRMGRDHFVERLDSIFEVANQFLFSGGKEVDAFSGISFVYNHGNQPCLHISWLFNEVERPSLTQKWVRAICNNFYGSDGIHGYGYGQDEDQGQLGAWYCISSLGLFDVKGLTDCEPRMALGSPLFDRATVSLHPDYYRGKELIIETAPHDNRSTYVSRFTFNGETLHSPHLSFKQLTNGGVLHMELSPQPCDDYSR